VVEALQALPGVQFTVAVPTVAALGDLTRFATPRELMQFLGLTPWEYSTGERRRQGAITTAGNTHARRALVEGAWAYRYPAKVSRHLQLRLETQPKAIQDISWKAQVRLCKRYRRLIARGQHANQVVVAMARELVGFMWAIAKQVPVTSSVQKSNFHSTKRRLAMTYLWIGNSRTCCSAAGLAGPLKRLVMRAAPLAAVRLRPAPSSLRLPAPARTACPSLGTSSPRW